MKHLILIILAVTLGACQSVPFPALPDSPSNTDSPTSPTETVDGNLIVISHIPKYGEKSDTVKTYQKALNKSSNSGISEDGHFGNVTKAATAKFQKSKGLEGTGIPGPKTIELLGLTIGTPSTGSPSQAVLQKLTAIASASSCASVSWPYKRGNTPIGYDKGMAVLYAKSYCNQFRSDVAYVAQPASTRTGDVLRTYAPKLKEAGLDKVSPLRQVWTILMGLGTMETSGKYCSGADYSTTQFKNANAAESGVMQTSWDVSAAHVEMRKLFEKYKADESKCYKDIFAEGVSAAYCSSDSNTKSYGKPTDTGYQFQELQKRCPALAVEYAAVTVRVAAGPELGHYGPLRCDKPDRCYQTRVELKCSSMFASIESYIDANPTACNVL